MVNLYDSKETDFSNNGLVVLNNCKFCFVTEENNGEFELEAECVLDSRRKWQYITEGNIIKADDQLFRIYRKTKTLSGIKFNARHIFYDLLDNLVEEIDIRGLSGIQALEKIMSNTAYPHQYRYMSDITKANNIYLDDEKGDVINKNPVEAIFKLISIYGGELVRDNFNIKWLQQRGQDRGVLISYGKNIKGIEENINLDSVITRIKPVGKDGLTLDEKYIDSPYINNFPYPKVKVIEFQDCNSYEDLRAATKEHYTNTKCDIPKANYKIDFVELSKTEEYKHYKVLERVYVGDTVTIRHSRLNISLKCKVIKIKKDVLTDKIIEVELGNFKPNINSAFDSISTTLKKVSTTIVKNKSDLNKAIDNATKLLTSELGGYVLKKENEILIMDTQDEKTATKVWRWNLNGLGYSGTGVNGKYRTAITMDGSIVADFITAGELNGNILKAGTIKTESLNVHAQQEIGKVSKLETKIETQAGKISLVVSEQGNVIGDNLISAINLSTKKIELSALNINLTGYVTFNELKTSGTTQIHGGNIITNTINFSDLRNKPYIPSSANDVSAIPSTYIDAHGVFTPQIYATNINIQHGKIKAETIDVDELSSQISHVGKFVTFGEALGNGIGITTNGEYINYLTLVSYNGIYMTTSDVYTSEGRVATREWVRNQSSVATFG